MNAWPRAMLFLAGAAVLALAGAAKAADNRILLAGQVMIQNNLAAYDAPQYDANAPLQAIKRDLDAVLATVRANDAVILELETALKLKPAQGLPAALGRDKDSDFFHEVERDAVIALIKNKLRLAGSQVMFAGANNHIGDNGAAGIDAMAALFTEIDVGMAGIGKLAAAASPRYLMIAPGTPRAQQVALVAFATDKVKLIATMDAVGANSLAIGGVDHNTLDAADERRIYANLALAHDKGATVIAYQHNHHWTQQQVNQAGAVEQWRIDFARRCIERGADAYFSHGEPRLQGIEIYRGKPIFYGLGNFMFQTRKVDFYQAEVWESVLVELEYDSATMPGAQAPRPLKAIKLIPVILNERGAEPVAMQTRGLPALARGAQARAILDKLRALSEPFGTQVVIDDSVPEAVVGRIRIRQ